MNELIAYLLKASAGTVILYLCFLFFFRKDTFYFRNRIILILTLILPLVIPLIKISGFAVKSIQPEEVTIGATVINSAITVGETFTNKVNSFDYNGLIITTWMCFAGLLILRMIFGIIKTASIIRKGHVRSDEFPKLIISDIAHPAFSFWPYAVIPRKIFENGDSEDIITHENAHIRQGHTFDLIICELYTSLFWFNPAAWFIKKSVRLNHEFLADQELTRRTADIKNYQYQLLNIPEEFNHLQLAHSFNNLIKNRIVMINKKPTGTYATLKNLLILPVVALIFAAFSFKAVNQMDNNTIASSDAVKTTPQNTEAANSVGKLTDIALDKPEAGQRGSEFKNNADTVKKSTNTISFVPGIGNVYAKVDQMPQFPGGEKEMIKFISDNIKYPPKAKEMGIQGTVIASFIVNDKGKVVNVKIARGVGSGCDEEALRVINSMPDWIPGKQGGKEVAVSYKLPVAFRLQSEKTVNYQQKLNVDSLLALQNIEDRPVMLIDGRVAKRSEIKPEDIYSISVLKNESAIKAYGEKAKNGMILITSKQEEKRQTVDGERAFVVVEQMPQFPGGEDAMKQFIKDNLKYPEEAQKQNKQGTIIINFIIDKEGKIRNPKVMRGIVKSLDDEALKVPNLMPAWAPGKQGGKPVAVSYTVPFKFVMN